MSDNIGTQFEKDLSEEFGLRRTPGSGNRWYSKLDLFGLKGRWSLKATNKKSISISQDIIDEAIKACYGPSGNGETPLWALRIGSEKYDLIVMLKEDFKKLQERDTEVFINQNIDKKLLERREKARLPSLLRDGN